MDAETRQMAWMRAFGIAALLAAIVAVGCSPRQANRSSSTSPADAPSYIVRGEVISIPEKDKPGTQLIVRHEPIDSFRDAEGQIVGMSTMGMPFTPGKGVSLEGIKPGDKVEMRWVMQWKPETKEYVESVRKLPAETQLRFGEAHPPATPATIPSGQ
jgi:Cu/Ag efflux protein CusF